MSKKTAGKPVAEVTVVNADVERMRRVLETLFDDNPHIRNEINVLWDLIEGMGNQMTGLGKGIGSLNELVIELKQQRDEQVAINSEQWDYGYEAGEKVGAFMQGRDVFNQKTLDEEVANRIYDALFVQADLDDAQLFAEALMSGELVLDEGEKINHLVAVVAERVRQQAEELENEHNEK